MITLSDNGKWKNSKTGLLSKDKNSFNLRFIEMNKSMDKYIYGSEEWETKCPIVATGFLAYLIETLQTKDNISSKEIYEKYFNYQYQRYIDKVKILPNFDENEAKKVFIKTYIEDEKKHIEKSKVLYGYLYDNETNLVEEYIQSYFKYIAEKQSNKTSSNKADVSSKEKKSTRQEPTDEGLEVIKSYFFSKFYGVRSATNDWEDCLKPALKKQRIGRDYETVALLIHRCKEINDDKMPRDFSIWYEIFCKSMNIKKCTYKPSRLDISKFLNEFYYLHLK